MNLAAIRYVMYSALIGLALVTGVFAQESDEDNLPAIENPGFAPVSAALAGKTLVPLVIPSTLPKSYKQEVGEFFCTVDTLEPNEYEVTIGFDKDCHGGNACRIGSFSGMRSRRRHITGSRNFPFEARRARRIKLYGGIYGYFVDSECGANCDDSKLYWRQGNYEYMVGLKAEKMKQVVELANSAIRNSKLPRRAKSNSVMQGFARKVCEADRKLLFSVYPLWLKRPTSNHHGDTEDTEIAQRRIDSLHADRVKGFDHRLFVQSCYAAEAQVNHNLPPPHERLQRPRISVPLNGQLAAQ